MTVENRPKEVLIQCAGFQSTASFFFFDKITVLRYQVYNQV